MRHVTVAGLPPVSKVGLGTMRFGEKGFSPDLARALVKRALELGITHFDTSEEYGFGRSERLLGEALRAEGAIIAGPEGAAAGTVVLTSKYAPTVMRASAIVAHARNSRDRLGVDTVSLYLLHAPNPLLPNSVTAAGFRQAVGEKIIAAAGISNHSLAQWQATERAYGQPVIANEVLFNILRPKALRKTIPWAAENGRLVIAASPLGQGILTGRYSPDALPSKDIAMHRKLAMAFSAARPTSASLRKLEPLLSLLREIAARHGVPVATISLAWAIAHHPMIVIPGASSIEQVEANAAAGDITLAPGEIADITAASAAVRGK